MLVRDYLRTRLVNADALDLVGNTQAASGLAIWPVRMGPAR
jgi:hypothetical protein